MQGRGRDTQIVRHWRRGGQARLFFSGAAAAVACHHICFPSRKMKIRSHNHMNNLVLDELPPDDIESKARGRFRRPRRTAKKTYTPRCMRQIQHLPPAALLIYSKHTPAIFCFHY
jgi:hypothetical protein